MKYIKVDHREPLQEGKAPKSYTMDPGGQLYEIVYEPSDFAEEKLPETETYKVLDKEEYWGHETVCKACNTHFMAYDDESVGYSVRNYCPGCGRRLE